MLTFQVNNVLSKIIHIALSHYSTKQSDHVVSNLTRNDVFHTFINCISLTLLKYPWRQLVRN